MQAHMWKKLVRGEVRIREGPTGSLWKFKLSAATNYKLTALTVPGMCFLQSMCMLEFAKATGCDSCSRWGIYMSQVYFPFTQTHIRTHLNENIISTKRNIFWDQSKMPHMLELFVKNQIESPLFLFLFSCEDREWYKECKLRRWLIGS